MKNRKTYVPLYIFETDTLNLKELVFELVFLSSFFNCCHSYGKEEIYQDEELNKKLDDLEEYIDLKYGGREDVSKF